MRDLKERKIGGDLAEEEPLQKKPTLIKPLPLRAQAKLPSGLGSAFKPWKKPSGNNGTDPAKPHDHKLDTSSNNHAPPENDNNEKNLENPNSNQPVEDQNPTNGSGAIATSGASIDENTAKAIEAQAIQPFLDSNTQIEMDRKLRKYVCVLLLITYTQLQHNYGLRSSPIFLDNIWYCWREKDTVFII